MKKPIKAFMIDRLVVRIYESRKDVGEAAYESYRRQVLTTLSLQGKARAVFAAAHSQDDFLLRLSQDESIDFSRITAFHMDEYIGLPENAPQKFGNFLKESIFSKRPFGKINYIHGNEGNEEECSRYTALLKEAPIDITSMGIGENGHIAFNDPAEANFNDPKWMKITHLDSTCREQQVHDKEFDNINDVPKTAYTMTIPALMSSKSIICIVPTRLKATAVHNMLCGPISEECPASILRTHDNAILLLDKEAASKI